MSEEVEADLDDVFAWLANPSDGKDIEEVVVERLREENKYLKDELRIIRKKAKLLKERKLKNRERYMPNWERMALTGKLTLHEVGAWFIMIKELDEVVEE